MNITLYHIDHILRCFEEKIIHEKANDNVKNLYLSNFHQDIILSSDGKKRQLVDQLIVGAMEYFATGVWEKKLRRITGDLLQDISDEDER